MLKRTRRCRTSVVSLLEVSRLGHLRGQRTACRRSIRAPCRRLGRPRARARAGRPRRRDHAGPLPRRGSRGRDQARPDAGDRGRHGGRAGVRERLAAARPGDAVVGEEYGGSSAPRRAPALDHRSDRRHQELRARDPGVGDAARARGRRRGRWSASSRRRRCSRRWWAGRGATARSSTTAERRCRACASRRSRELGDAQLCFAGLEDWDAIGGLDALLDARPPLLAHARVRRLLGVHAGGRGRAPRSRLDPEVSLWDLAAPQVIVEEAGGRFTDLGGVRTRRRRRRDRDQRPRARRGAGDHRPLSARRILDVMERCSATMLAPAATACVRARRRAAGDADAAADARRVRRPGPAAARRARRCGARSRRARPHSMILHGPPGSGKTTLARIIAEASAPRSRRRARSQAGRAEVRAVIERARERLRGDGHARRSSSSTRSTASTRPSRTRCCRRSRTGCVTLIGATTENPYFEVNSALISRTHVYELDALTRRRRSASLLDRAVARGECGPGGAGRARGARVPRRARRAATRGRR